MKKSEQISKMLEALGFEPTSDFHITKGPKVKPDIVECWNVNAKFEGRYVTIYSADTMTRLVKTGIEVRSNDKFSYLYGDYIAEPKS